MPFVTSSISLLNSIAYSAVKLHYLKITLLKERFLIALTLEGKISEAGGGAPVFTQDSLSGGEARRTGINAVNLAPWGTHFCQLFESQEELTDIFIPYLKAGLESNERCVWVASDFFSKTRAEEAIRMAVPNGEQYLTEGQIDIVPYTEQYLRGGVTDPQGSLSLWIDRLNRALAEGYDGLRVASDVSWLQDNKWKEALEFEKQVDGAVGDLPVLILCSYPLVKYGINEIMQVMRPHGFLIIRRNGEYISLGRTEQTTSIKQLTPLQRWFIKSGFEGFSNGEIIELLLSVILPFNKSVILAKRSLTRFKSLVEFLSASPQALEEIGIPPYVIFCIKLLRELPTEVLRHKIIEKPFYTSSKEVFDYLYYSMRYLKKEVFKVIFLNNQMNIIDAANLYEGKLDHVPIRPREIVENASKHNATALIFAHNHPSGDPAPSKLDKQLTRDLAFVGTILQIRVLDHIIIGHNTYFSFADAGLIEEYELDYLNLKLRGTSRARQRPSAQGQKN